MSDPRQLLDAAVAASRAAQVPGVQEQRRVRRYSVAELNEMDSERLAEAIANTEFDGRGPVTRAIDMLDAPRTAILRALVPAARRVSERNRATGERAAFGVGRVTFADVLGEAGMRPGLLRGALGFLGDVAFDPLTYVGPAGWGAKAVGVGGRTVQVGAQGRRLLLREARRFGRGGTEAVQNTILRRGLESGAVIRPGALERLDAARKAAAERARASGLVDRAEQLARGVTPQDRAAMLVSRVLGRPTTGARATAMRAAGFDAPFTSSGGGALVANAIDRVPTDVLDSTGRAVTMSERFRERVAARGSFAREFVGRFGVGGIGSGRGVNVTRKGIEFGDAGSQIAHIPFTEVGVFVPAFTPQARVAQGLRRMSRMAPAAGAATGVTLMSRAFTAMNAQDIDAIERLVNADTVLAADPSQAANIDSAREATREALSARVAAMRQRAERLSEAIRNTPVEQLGEANLLHALRARQHALAAANLAESRAKTAAPFANIWFDALPEATSRERMFAPELAMKRRSSLADGLQGFVGADPEYRRLQDEMAKIDEMTADVEGRNPTALHEEYRELIRQSAERAGVLREQYRARLTDGQLALLDAADEDIENAASVAEAFALQSESLHRLAGLTGASVAGIMDDGAKAMTHAARHLLDLSDEAVGISPFASMRVAVERTLDTDEGVGLGVLQTIEEADRIKRRAFGNRRGQSSDVFRRAALTLEGDARRQALNQARPVLEAVRAIRRDYDLSDDALDQLAAVITAQIYARHSEVGNGPWQDALRRVVAADGSVEHVPEGNAAWIDMLDDARKNGLLDEAQHPGITQRINEVAAEVSRLLDEARDAGLDDDILRTVKRSYVPAVSLPEFNQQVARAKANRAGTLSAGQARATEAFQKPSSTWEYRFTDDEGKIQMFREYERHIAALPEIELEGLDPALKAQAQAVKSIIDKFERLTPGMEWEDRLRQFARPMDLFTIDRARKAGEFAAITGTSLTARMFADNALYALSERLASQSRAAAVRGLASYMERHAKYLKNAEVVRKGADAGELMVTLNGEPAQVRVFGQGSRQQIRVNGVAHRQILDVPAAFYEGRGLAAGLAKALRTDAYYPTPLADAIEQFARFASDDESVRRALKMIDVATTYWKGATLMHPAWTVFNIVGSLLLMAQGRASDPVRFASFAPRALRSMIQSRGGRLPSTTATLRGAEVSMADVLDDATRLGVINTNMAAEMVAPILPDGRVSVPDFVAEAGRGSSLRRQYKAALEQELTAKAVGAAATTGDKLNAARKAIAREGYVRRVFSQWAAMNGFIENWMRLTAYMSLIDMGENPISAARRVRDTMFDFTDMTSFERGVRRYVMPFYAWLRSNGAYQLRQLFANPKWAAMTPKLKELIEESTAEHDQIPDHLRPEWMRELATIQIGDDPESRIGFTAGTVLPAEPVYQALSPVAGGASGAMHLLDYLGSSVNPVLTLGLQLGQGREAFTGRTIGPGFGDADLTALEFVANQFVPRVLREILPTGTRTPPLVAAYDKGLAPGTLRLLLGGRAQPMDDERLRRARVRELQEAEGNLRRAVVMAESNGRRERSFEARTRLMALYAAAIRDGLGDEVPVWAREQLAAMASPTGAPAPAAP